MDRRKRTMISHGRMRQTNQTKIVTVKKGNVRETSRRVHGAHDYGLSQAHKYNLVFSERGSEGGGRVQVISLLL